MKIVFNILFLTFNNVNIKFTYKKLIKKTYITKNAFPINKQIRIIDKRIFVKNFPIKILRFLYFMK